jgi:hypothetical protein
LRQNGLIRAALRLVPHSLVGIALICIEGLRRSAWMARRRLPLKSELP